MIKFDYPKEIETFINYVDEQLKFAWEEKTKGNYTPSEKLHDEKFELTFRGATLELNFGGIEYDAIIECLEKIKEVNEYDDIPEALEEGENE